MLAAVTTFCDGSKDKVLAFGFAVKSRGALDSTLPTGQTDYTPWVAVTVSS